MKRATLPIFFAGSKRWVPFIIILILNLAGASNSEAQGVSAQVNSYIKTQVKETTIKGVILVAENMTDWLSQANATSESLKKTDHSVPASVLAPRAYSALIKPKSLTAIKPIKQP